MTNRELLLMRQESTLAKVMEMIKYAEAKNLALLTFNLAILVALSGILTLDFSKAYVWIPLIFWGLSTLLSIISFVPITNSTKQTLIKGLNLTYFGDIAKLSSEEFHKLISVDYCSDDKYCSLISDQIVINSRIANRKFDFFKLAIRTLFVITLLLYVVDFLDKSRV